MEIQIEIKAFKASSGKYYSSHKFEVEKDTKFVHFTREEIIDFTEKYVLKNPKGYIIVTEATCGNLYFGNAFLYE